MRLHVDEERVSEEERARGIEDRCVVPIIGSLLFAVEEEAGDVAWWALAMQCNGGAFCWLLLGH